MSALLSTIVDSPALQIIFAAWTGFYLWQIISGSQGSQRQDFLWMVAGFVVAIFYLGGTVKQGT
jgi:hypothetical protein